ncbi:hypothetical protein MJO28_006954 [Puccinia striiformis f. sp. tritici]|uniref:Uncharacterized protein n=1 Tax=Puccinia striiformis f. sp. tritici TaxID=168172 RepID=A0ACC0ED39_9BASI|nr:hypothetical protein MJO28_006954 [Puccinia striiformis f. sp. tritici]
MPTSCQSSFGELATTHLGTRLSERSPMRFSGVESILGWQRFVINAFARRDLIQVVVLHKNKVSYLPHLAQYLALAYKPLSTVKLFLGSFLVGIIVTSTVTQRHYSF